MRRALPILAAAVALGGCGHVQVLTNDPDARIFANDAYVGKGEAELPRRMGPPGSMEIRVEGAGATVRRVIRREITAVTVVFGLYSYFTSFIWGWQYPQQVYVALPARRGGGWDEEPSAWDAPPSRWGDPSVDGGTAE